jgi:CRISPR/Cas system CMR subunit Cmr6 (Cas7 group RAMP superfamily)
LHENGELEGILRERGNDREKTILSERDDVIFVNKETKGVYIFVTAIPDGPNNGKIQRRFK